MLIQKMRRCNHPFSDANLRIVSGRVQYKHRNWIVTPTCNPQTHIWGFGQETQDYHQNSAYCRSRLGIWIAFPWYKQPSAMSIHNHVDVWFHENSPNLHFWAPCFPGFTLQNLQPNFGHQGHPKFIFLKVEFFSKLAANAWPETLLRKHFLYHKMVIFWWKIVVEAI